MRHPPGEATYAPAQIGLHWTIAAAIAVLIPLGLWMTGLDYYDPWYVRAPDLHRAIGVLAGIALLLRIVVTLTRTRPRPLGVGRRGALLVHVVHGLLYLLPALLVISGYLVSTADGRAVDVFGWFSVPATLHGIDGQADVAGEVHFWLAMGLLGIVAIHVGAALRHHFILHDATLTRMLPFLGISSTEQTRK